MLGEQQRSGSVLVSMSLPGEEDAGETATLCRWMVLQAARRNEMRWETMEGFRSKSGSVLLGGWRTQAMHRRPTTAPSARGLQPSREPSDYTPCPGCAGFGSSVSSLRPNCLLSFTRAGGRWQKVGGLGQTHSWEVLF